MKCPYLSLRRRLLHLLGALRSKMTAFCSRTAAAAARGRTKLLRLYGVCPDKEAAALYSVHLASSPASLFAAFQVSLGLKVLFFSLLSHFFFFFFNGIMIDFHVDVISKLCLWLSQFVFDWSAQHVGSFSGGHGRSRWLSRWQETEESAVSAEQREREREAAAAELPHLSVGGRLCVCVCTRECVSLCQ